MAACVLQPVVIGRGEPPPEDGWDVGSPPSTAASGGREGAHRPASPPLPYWAQMRHFDGRTGENGDRRAVQ